MCNCNTQYAKLGHKKNSCCVKTKIKGIYSPESLQHDKHVQTMHVLPQVNPGNLLKMQTFEI